MKAKSSYTLPYLFFRELLSLPGYLPMWFHYLFVDLFFFPLLYYVIGYRKKVVFKNLRNSFPEKSEAEIRQIARGFYRFMCDQLVETIKLIKTSPATMKQKMRFENTEVVDQLLEKNKSVILQLGHYANWEYIPSLRLWFDHPNLVGGQIYRRLNNHFFDQFFLDIRHRFGTVCIEKNRTLSEMARYIRDGKQVVIGFMADQKPSPNNQHYWTTFLNQETSMLTGVERIASRMQMAVVYLDIQPLKRGSYVGRFELVSEDASQNKEFEITEIYTRKMEQTIMRNPSYWLWTHNRWKHKRIHS